MKVQIFLKIEQDLRLHMTTIRHCVTLKDFMILLQP